MRCLQKCLLLSLIMLCVACSNRQFEGRLTETEQNTTTVQNDVQALEQRVQSMENRLADLSTEVTSLEVKTLKGKKTNYMVVPAIKAGSVAAPASVSQAGTSTARTGSAAVAVAPSTTPRVVQSVRPPVAPASAGTRPPMVSPPVQSSPTLSLPPATAPVLSNGGSPTNYAGTGASGATSGAAPVMPSVASPEGAPTTPIPVQSAVSLALPPENAAAGQKAPASTSTPATLSTSSSASAASAAPARTAPLAPKQKGEEAAYNAALALARAGQSTEAINRFKAFLQEYPSGRYAPNAYYWIGECMYAQRQYADALLQFKDVATRYPRHHKSADALLKAGMTYTRMGDKENASLQYKAVVTDFPASEAARYVKGRGLAR